MTIEALADEVNGTNNLVNFIHEIKFDLFFKLK